MTNLTAGIVVGVVAILCVIFTIMLLVLSIEFIRERRWFPAFFVTLLTVTLAGIAAINIWVFISLAGGTLI